MQTCDLPWEELDQVGGALSVHVPGIARVSIGNEIRAWVRSGLARKLDYI